MGRNRKKSDYTWATYDLSNSGGYLTRYCNNSLNGYDSFQDDILTLDESDDVAHGKQGGNWRIPSNNEFEELLSKCIWTWITQNGVNGYKVTSKIDGYTDCSIFLPAAGYSTNTDIVKAGSNGSYWSASLNPSDSRSAFSLNFSSSNPKMNSSNRYVGQSIRPVCPSTSWKGITTFLIDSILYLKVDESDKLDRNIKSGEEDYSFYDQIRWTSSDESVATVSSDGTVDAKSAGKAIISATCRDKTERCVVIVLEREYDNGYEYVDLGLSVKWAAYNVGASSPEEYGDYYAWGEIKTKTNYTWSSYKYCNGAYNKQTKYNTNASFGTVDNISKLESVDDVAHVNWGGKWRFPSKQEYDELLYSKNCVWTWTNIDGVNGFKITSLKKGYEGHSIFLPAAGSRNEGNLDYVASELNYWSSSLGKESPDGAWRLIADNGEGISMDSRARYCGRSVRPVIPSDTWVGITSISINKDSLFMKAFSTSKLIATLMCGNDDYSFFDSIKWSSDNETVVEVDADGTVLAVGKGKAIITATYKTLTADCVVYVNGNVDLRLDKDSLSINLFSTYKLIPCLTDGVENYTLNYPILWSSDNELVAKVDADGTVRAIEKGKAIITATYKTLTAYSIVEVSGEHDYVDLGLSVNWATCNVGAFSPEEHGDHYAWGEIETKDTYSRATYKYCNGSDTSLTKYCNNSYYGHNGFVDNKNMLDMEDDVAHVKWGGNWYMPRQEHFNELLNNCTWTSIVQNGVNCYKVTSNINGNYIILPTTNSKYDMYYYWSSSIGSYPYYAKILHKNGGEFSILDAYRQGDAYCHSVRPVCPSEKYVTSINISIDTLNLIKGDVSILKATVMHDKEICSSLVSFVCWESDNTDVVSVDENGMLMANSVGVAHVKASVLSLSSQCTVTVVEESENELGYVDLGLSVNWATCNVGATKPEEYGDYYAWGETEPKTNYDWPTYNWCDGASTALTKYCNNSNKGSDGFTDTLTVLTPEDDVAHAQLGDNWRMPTKAEWEELRTNCTWTWITSANGVNGYRVTSNKSGYKDRSIFLPAAGVFQNSSLNNDDINGYYWSSSLASNASSAQRIGFNSRTVIVTTRSRCDGLSVRPVCP